MKYKLTVIIPVYNQEDLILKAIKSIPIRDDIEIIVIDDCSTDNTLENVRTFQQISNYDNLVVLYNQENKGVGYTVNKGIDNAQGEYIVLLGSDDYFIKLEKCLPLLDGTDIIYFDLRINNGNVFRVTEETKRLYCGSVKFIRRDFIGDLREPEIRVAEDYYFYNDLLKKNPTEKFTNIIFKHYNFPRKGSLTDKNIHG